MGSSQIISPYEYTSEQAEVLRLQDLYRRALLDQKYYAHRLSRYKFWDGAANIVAAIATLLSVAGFNFLTSHKMELSTFVGLLSGLILVVRPLCRPSENIERYSRLHYGYTELFFQIENLLAKIRHNEGVREDNRNEMQDIIERYKNLAVQEDPSANKKKVESLQAEVETAIPVESLWLPASDEHGQGELYGHQ